MEPSVLQASCHTNDFLSVESTLRTWEEVEAVGSLREKQNNKEDVTTVIIKCKDGDAANHVKEKLSLVPGIIEETKGKPTSENKKSKNAKSIDITAEVLGAIPEIQRRNNTDALGGRGRGRRQRGGGRNGNWQRQGNNRGRGNQGGNGNQNGGRGNQRGRFNRGRGGNRQFQRMPLVEASAAFIDNLPFGVPNSRLLSIFSAFGHVIDISRFETMAMVCYENPESVQECIQALNGSKINENIITVSSGTVRIPGEVVSSLV